MRRLVFAWLIFCAAPSSAQSMDDAPQLVSRWFDLDKPPTVDANTVDRQASTVVPFGRSDKKRRSKDKFDVGLSEGDVAPQGKSLGVGGQIGVPTAVTLKYMLTEDQGLVGGIGFGLGWVGAPALSFHFDYHWHPHILARGEPFKLSWYFGGGLWAGFAYPVWGWGYGGFWPYSGFYYGWLLGPYAPPWFGIFSLGGRVPVGLDLALNELPLSFYIELAPSLLVWPALGIGLGGAIGIRFYFM
jgi:hypothetical protein